MPSIANASTSYPCYGYPPASYGANVACTSGNVVVTNTIIDVGQFTFITVNGIVGGIPPYSGNWFYTSANIPLANTISNTFINGGYGNAIILGVNAFAANQLTLTAYNGLVTAANIMYTITVFNAISSPTTNTIYGSWTFNAFVKDATSNALETNSIPLITIDPAPTISITSTTPTAPAGIDAGNTITFNALVTGGTGPFTYTFYISNSVTKIPVNTFSAGSTNSFIFTTNTALIGNTLVANVFVTDNVGATANSVLTGIFTVNAVPTISITKTTPTAPAGIDAGNTITFNALVTGGTGPFTYTFYISNSVTKIPVNTFSAGSTNSFIFTTNTNLIGNTLVANVFVTDGVGSTVNSVLTGIFTVNAVPTISITSTTPTAPAGIYASNTITFNALVIGGTGPYTYTFYISNSVTKIPVNTFSAGSTNSFIFTTNTALIGNTLAANVFVTDGFSITANSALTGIFTVNTAPTVLLSASTTSTTIGIPVTFTANILNGVGPFNIALFIAGTQQGSNVIIASPGGSNTITVYGTSITTLNYNIVATDTGAAISYVFNSATMAVTFNPNPSSGGSGVSGGGGGAAPPAVTVYSSGNQTGYTITNLSVGNSETLHFNNNTKTINITVNFITPTNVSVTINGKAYSLTIGSTVTLIDPVNYTYYARLTGLVYLPSQHTTTLIIYGQPNVPSATTTSITTASTTTVAQTTVATTSIQTTTVLTTIPTTTIPSTSYPTMQIAIAVAIIIILILVWLWGRTKKSKPRSSTKSA